jgi:hypothetical protein
MTPPMTPATPPGVPVPYPNTGMASDTTSGSTTVKVSGKEVMLKNKSYFKSSTGDEAGCATKKGVVSSVNRGKVYFAAWSMDVKIEGENAVRHLDITTHNHGSAGNGPPWPFIDSAAALADEDHPCHQEVKNERAACKNLKDPCDDGPCEKARKCMLVPYVKKGSPRCCPGKTAHHIVPNSLLQRTRGDATTNIVGLKRSGSNAYNVSKGACVCATGKSHNTGEHGKMHTKTKDLLSTAMKKRALTFKQRSI